VIVFGQSKEKPRRGRNRGCAFLQHTRENVAFRSRALGPFVSAILAATISVVVPAANAAPYKPTNDAQQLEQLPTSGNQPLRELRRLHAELSHRPEDLALALRVASQDIQAARSESDPRYNGYAEAALGPWLSAPRPPSSVLLVRATLRQAIHDFSGAREDLSRVISDDPRNVQARLTRATILQVQGLYDEALVDCRSLALLAEELVTTTCLASVYALHGRAKYGQQVLQAAIARAPSQEVTDIRLWALTLLAEAEARVGDVTAAEGHFHQALSLGVRDVYLLGAYADFLLDAGRPSEVQALLKNEVRIDPLLLRLALAEQSLAAPVLSSHVADLAERFSMSRLRGDVSHQREEARFTLHLLNKAQEGLQLAASNWSVQREPWDTRLLLEAALSTGTISAARPALDWLAKVQLEDERLRQLASRLAELDR
jgi:tetratricopeptide (TPR) repeat protein